VSEPTSPTLTYTEAKEIVKAWRKDFRLGVGDEYVIKAFLDTEAELKTLRAQLTAATARAEAAEADAATCNHYATRALAAEAKLAAVPLEAIAACLRCIGHYAPHALGTYSPRTVAAWLEARGVQYQAAVELVEEQEEEETD
jgi:hypothetical protein